MAHYAKVVNGTVTKIIVAEADFFDTFVDDIPGEWIQTSYNTREGVHKLGGTPLRKNFAAIGGTYDATRDAFLPPKLHASWTLDENTSIYVPPTPYPTDGKDYVWNETTKSWVEEVD